MTVATAATLTVWRIRPRHVPRALAQVGTFRPRRGPDDRVFAKLVGTAGARFTPRDARPTRWALVAGWADAESARRFAAQPRSSWFDRHALESGTLVMRPVWSRGSWDGRQPFGVGDVGDERAGPVVALTRSTVRARAALRFYRAVPAVARDVQHADGMRLTFGIGERPVLRQGTISVWEDVEAMRAFAHRTAAHVAVVRDTPRIGWYGEEMFTRFALVDTVGTFDGMPLVLDQVTA